MKAIIATSLKTLAYLCLLIIIYLLTLCFPQSFYKDHVTAGNISIYSDQEIPQKEIKQIIQEVQNRIERSELYKRETKHRIFITNNDIRWRYFTNINYKVGGLNYVIFNHNVFLRKADIANNRLYGYSGKKVPGDRTLDYFIAHEITHTLEFQSMPWYKYPVKTNWVLEGYAEYIAHNSQSYEGSLDYYLNIPETTGAKYYTRARTMVSYMLEKKNVPISNLWSSVGSYDSIILEAIPNNKPNIDDSMSEAF